MSARSLAGAAGDPPAELVWPRHYWSGECCYSDLPAEPGQTRCPAGHVLQPVEVVPLLDERGQPAAGAS